MKWIEDGSRFVVRFDVAEKLPETLLDFSKRLGLVSGWLSGIGGVQNVVLAYYDLTIRKYVTFSVSGMVELISLSGNIALVNGQPIWHLHASVADREGNVKGGHLVGLEVAITLECVIQRGSKMLQRRQDDYSGLNLLEI